MSNKDISNSNIISTQECSEKDKELLLKAIQVSKSAVENGNHPFGAILVDSEGKIVLEAENTCVTEKNSTGHAELNLVAKATNKFKYDELAKMSLYSSCEPCAMCSGAIFWSNIRRVVYALSEDGLYKEIPEGTDSEHCLYIPCRTVLSHGRKPIVVIGPALEDEASQPHKGFWTPSSSEH